MKKVLAVSVIALLVTSSFALDVSKETSADRSVKKDQSMSAKTSNEDRNTNRKSKTNSLAKSYAADITYDPTPAYLMVADECVSSLSVAADFGLSANIGDGVIDLNRKQYIENQASQAGYLSDMGADEVALKEHIACVLINSAKMAQASLNLAKTIGGKKFSSDQIEGKARDEFLSISSITNRSIFTQLSRSVHVLKTKRCRFVPGVSHEVIQCGSLVYSFGDNSVKFGSEPLTGNGQLFGVTTAFRVSLSDTNTDANEVADEFVDAHSYDATLTKTKSATIGTSTKKSTNIAPFLPK